MLNVTAIRNVWRRANSLLPSLVALYSRVLNASQHFVSLVFVVFLPFITDEFRSFQKGSILEIKPLEPIFADNLEKKRRLRFFPTLPSSISNRSLVMLFYTGHFPCYTRNHVSTIDLMARIPNRGVEPQSPPPFGYE
jgi:hypothetical protein